MLLFVLVLLPFGMALTLLGVKFWRMTVIVVLVWTLVEGAVRKWVFPAYQAPILQLKDIALIAAYAGCLASNRPRLPAAERNGALAVLTILQVIYCLAEILNPYLPTPLLGFYGFKLYVVYLPLALVIPEIFTTREQIQKLLFWSCISAIPLGLLGLYQFSQPPTSWINQYVSHEVGQETVVSLFGGRGEGDFRAGRARTSGTFSYIGGYTTYLLAALSLALGAILSARRNTRLMLIAGAAFVLALGATFTTGSRTPVAVFAIVAPMMLLVAGGKGLLPMSAAMRLVAMGTIALAVGGFLFRDAANAFWFRAENADSTSGRLLSPITETFDAFQTSPLFGTGVGSNANVGASLVDPSFYWLDQLYELEPARVMQDLGIVGFTLLYVAKFWVIWLAMRSLKWSRSRLFIAMHLAAIAFMVPHVILFTINNATGGVFFWAFAGISIAMFRIERAERRTAAMLAAIQAEPAPTDRQPALA